LQLVAVRDSLASLEEQAVDGVVMFLPDLGFSIRADREALAAWVDRAFPGADLCVLAAVVVSRSTVPLRAIGAVRYGCGTGWLFGELSADLAGGHSGGVNVDVVVLGSLTDCLDQVMVDALDAGAELGAIDSKVHDDASI
jgi:hypothetical protein